MFKINEKSTKSKNKKIEWNENAAQKNKPRLLF